MATNFSFPLTRRTIASANLDDRLASEWSRRNGTDGVAPRLTDWPLGMTKEPLMRKQYHFRPGPAGLRAWDVDRLVSLSKDFVPALVPIEDIREMDETYWGGSMTRREVAEHARLIQEADLNFPIILSSDGRIMDGMHRVLKSMLLGLSHVPAVRFSSDPMPDYVGVDPEALPYEQGSRLTAEERDA